jgi:hypothetical protein
MIVIVSDDIPIHAQGLPKLVGECLFVSLNNFNTNRLDFLATHFYHVHLGTHEGVNVCSNCSFVFIVGHEPVIPQETYSGVQRVGADVHRVLELDLEVLTKVALECVEACVQGV